MAVATQPDTCVLLIVSLFDGGFTQILHSGNGLFEKNHRMIPTTAQD